MAKAARVTAAVLQALRAFPKGAYCRLVGRQQKVVDEQGRRYGWAVLGPSVDLTAVLPQILDTIAANRHRILSGRESAEDAAEDADDELGNLATRKLIEEITRLENQNRLLAAQIAAAESAVVPVAEVRARLDWLRDQLRAIGDALTRFPDAQRLFSEHLDRLAAELLE